MDCSDRVLGTDCVVVVCGRMVVCASDVIAVVSNRDVDVVTDSVTVSAGKDIVVGRCDPMLVCIVDSVAVDGSADIEETETDEGFVG